jgi:prepilin-type N-terminal cleavage/methylation domain-containing protein
MFKPKLLQQEQGFTLVEVLVAILITTLFVAIAMEGMVIATIFKVKAQENAEATTWIQEDLENVKYQAANLPLPQTTLAVNAAKEASSISVTSASIFAVNDTLRVGLDPINYQISAISGNTLTITPKLATDQLATAAVVATKKCNPTGATARVEGLADALRDKILTDAGLAARSDNSNDVDSNSPRTFRTGKKFTRRRTTTLSADFPHNVLEVRYQVSPGTSFDSSKLIANFDTEVIPNVAFQCPQK